MRFVYCISQITSNSLATCSDCQNWRRLGKLALASELTLSQAFSLPKFSWREHSPSAVEWLWALCWLPMPLSVHTWIISSGSQRSWTVSVSSGSSLSRVEAKAPFRAKWPTCFHTGSGCTESACQSKQMCQWLHGILTQMTCHANTFNDTLNKIPQNNKVSPVHACVHCLMLVSNVSNQSPLKFLTI